MTKANHVAKISADIKTVWEIVTNLEDASWRSDLSKIDILNESTFVEYTKDGFATTFHTTRMCPYHQWVFSMENKKMKGKWIGLFTQEGEETFLDFTEIVEVKSKWLKPFVKGYLKKQQARYIKDLKRAVERT